MVAVLKMAVAGLLTATMSASSANVVPQQFRNPEDGSEPSRYVMHVDRIETDESGNDWAVIERYDTVTGEITMHDVMVVR